MKKIGTPLVILFSILIAFAFLNNAAVFQGDTVKESVINEQKQAYVELKGSTPDEKLAQLKELVAIAKETGAIISYNYYPGDTVFDLFTSNVVEMKQIPNLNSWGEYYRILPIDALYSIIQDQQVKAFFVSGEYEELVKIAQDRELISKQVMQIMPSSGPPMSYQIVLLLFSIILIMSIVQIIYRTKKIAIQKIHGHSFLKRMLEGCLFDYSTKLIIFSITSLGYMYLLSRSYMLGMFNVYLEFMIFASILLFIVSIGTYCIVELFDIREAIKNKLPKSFLSVGIVIYKFIVSLLTLALAVSFSVQAQVAIDDVKSLKVYEQLSEYRGINYSEDLLFENMWGKSYEQEVYPLLNKAGAVYFDSAHVSSIIESIRNGKIPATTLSAEIENKMFQVNNNYILNMVMSQNKNKYMMDEHEPQIKVIAAIKDKEKLVEYERDKSKICNQLFVKNAEQCQNYNIEFVYYDGELDAIMPNPFLFHSTNDILKYPVLINFSQKANEELGIAKILSADGFGDPIRIKHNQLTDADLKKISKLMGIAKVKLVSASSGYENVIAQGKAKLQAALINLSIFLIASILLSISIVILYIEEYKKRIALEKFAGNTWYSRYGKIVNLVVWSWIVGFLLKMYFPIENILFNVHEQTYNSIFWIVISTIIISEFVILFIVTRIQEKKAIATILKNE